MVGFGTIDDLHDKQDQINALCERIHTLCNMAMQRMMKNSYGYQVKLEMNPNIHTIYSENDKIYIVLKKDESIGIYPRNFDGFEVVVSVLEKKGKENKVLVFKKTTLRELVNLIMTTPNVSCNLDRELVLQIQSPLEQGLYQPQYTQYLNHIFTGSGQVLLVGRTDDPAVILK